MAYIEMPSNLIKMSPFKISCAGKVLDLEIVTFETEMPTIWAHQYLRSATVLGRVRCDN